MTKRTAIYNTIRSVVSEYGGGDKLADELCARLGDEILDAVNAQVSEQYRDDDPPPRRGLGLTEVEAAMRWCPHAREATAAGKAKDVAIGNRYLDRERQDDYANPAGCRCIGSYCNAWRWLDDIRGYCGLAGRPHFQPVGEPRRLPNRTPLSRPTASEQRDLFDGGETND
jgi:hypothetical protein